MPAPPPSPVIVHDVVSILISAAFGAGGAYAVLKLAAKQLINEHLRDDKDFAQIFDERLRNSPEGPSICDTWLDKSKAFTYRIDDRVRVHDAIKQLSLDVSSLRTEYSAVLSDVIRRDDRARVEIHDLEKQMVAVQTKLDAILQALERSR